MNPQPRTAAAAAPQDGAIARQAIVDRNMRVVAYSLQDGHAHDAAWSEHDARFLRHALAAALEAGLPARRPVHLRCGIESLTDGTFDEVTPRGIVLEVALPAAFDSARIAPLAMALQALERRGFGLAFDHQALAPAWRSFLAHASFLRVDMQKLPRGLLAALVADARRLKHLTLVASNVQSDAEHEAAEGLGIELFQGHWYARPAATHHQLLRPAHETALQLIKLLREERPIEDVEAVLKRDAALSFNLLRFVNSAAAGGRQVTSLRTAAMLLGTKILFRWAALLLAAAKDGAPPALGKTAIVRARFMEVLAKPRMPAAGDNAFVVGAFSLLEAITGQPLPRVLENLALPDDVAQALLARTGPLAPFLTLAESCESVDAEARAQAAAVLHVDEAELDAAHLQALAWAEELLD